MYTAYSDAANSEAAVHVHVHNWTLRYTILAVGEATAERRIYSSSSVCYMELIC